jgi:V/A-type H+-transporting ATPase subunit F
MYKVGFVGGPDAAGVFRPLGVDVVEATTPEEAERALEQMAAGEYALVLLEEELGAAMTEVMERFRRRPLPVISLVPGAGGSLGMAEEAIRRMVERAVGTDILFKGEDG